VYNHEVLLRQGTTETSAVLQALSPAVNFPRQSVTDATDVIRPFTLRGLSPDHTLVLVNGLRRHQTAVVNTFAYGTPAGSSGVDMNAMPSSAIDRVEVLRDGAAAQYGSDAIAGVVNVVLRQGRFAPNATVTGGQYFTADYPRDGGTYNASGSWGLGLGKGSLMLAAEYLNRAATNRAWADSFEVGGTGVNDIIGPDGQVIVKRNPVPQPNHHWGDGIEKDVLTMASYHLPLSANSFVFAQGGYSHREGSGNGYRRYQGSSRSWDSIFPLGFLPEFHPISTDVSLAGGWKGEMNGWALGAGASFGHNGFEYKLRNTLNASLGGSLTTPTAPGPDGILGTADDPGIPNQTSFNAGTLRRDEFVGSLDASREVSVGLPNPVNLALGAAWRRERWAIIAGERASWIDGGAQAQDGSGKASAGSQVFAGFSPSDAVDTHRENVGAYAEAESKFSDQVLANAAARFENYSDFGSLVTGKFAMRVQPSSRVTLRGAASTGFRAPGLGQSHFSKVVTNVISGQPTQVGVFPVDHRAARAMGAQDLKAERSLNVSAGLAVTPLEGLTVTADLYEIWLKDRIILGATFADPTTKAYLQSLGIAGIDAIQYFTNGLDTKTTGVDLTADLQIPMSGDRSLSFNVAANYGKTAITRVDALPAVVTSHTAETRLLDEVTTVAITRERPDWRATLTTNYKQGPWRGLARASYYGTFASAQPAFTDGYTETYPLADAGRCRGRLHVRRGRALARRAQPVRHVSGQGEARLQQQLRRVPVGRGLAVRLQRSLRARAPRTRCRGDATLIAGDTKAPGGHDRRGPLAWWTNVRTRS
jgi:iron complex outermembrane receptor protein